MSYFFLNYGGAKAVGGTVIPNPTYIPPNGHDVTNVDLSYEEQGEWKAIPFLHVKGWRQDEWEYSPTRYVDGKDVGKIAARLFTPDGWPIPVRVSQIGGISMRIEGRDILSEYIRAERVVTMVVQPFPWAEVEEFAIHLQQDGIRLLPVFLDPATQIWESQSVTQATDNRSREEMFSLEEEVLAQAADIPTIVDGRLQAHSGGFDSKTCPVFGVIKTHQRIPLDMSRLKMLYALQLGQRLPAFIHAPAKNLTTLTWYLRIGEGGGQSALDGVVRIEVSLDWYESHVKSTNFVDRLSRVVMAYRCQRRSYNRAQISLEPIVRGEDRLGAVFGNYTRLLNHFYYLAHIS